MAKKSVDSSSILDAPQNKTKQHNNTTHNTMATYKVTFESMNRTKVTELFYDSDFEAVKFCRNTCRLFSLDNWDGSEGGGVGYHYRIRLETI